MLITIQHVTSKVIYLIRRLLAPAFCRCCLVFLSSEKVLCDSCRLLIKPVLPVVMKIGDARVMVVYALGTYVEPLKKLVLAKRRCDASASYQLGKLIGDLSSITTVSFDYIVPVPLHWTRYAARGFNQAEILAQQVSVLSGKPVVNVLKRIRSTKFQAGLSSVERARNVEMVFKLEASALQYKGARFLLIDDLMTTGATLCQAARALFKLQPSSVTAFVVCRTEK